MENYWVSHGHPVTPPPLQRFRSSPDLIRLSITVCHALACQESLNRDRLECLCGGEGGCLWSSPSAPSAPPPSPWYYYQKYQTFRLKLKSG